MTATHATLELAFAPEALRWLADQQLLRNFLKAQVLEPQLADVVLSSDEQ